MDEQERLRIALVSTPFVSTPPRGYGGTELVVAELARALAIDGVDVVVYATGDSELSAPKGATGSVEVRSLFSEAQWPPADDVDHTHAAWCLRDIARDPIGFDAVHLHSVGAVDLARLCPYPLLYTIHHDHDPRLSAIYARTPQLKTIGISCNQSSRETPAPHGVVYHGLDPARYPAMPDQGYLLFLGRYARVKGCVQAIETAERAGLPLVMAGQPHDVEYYENEVKPLIARHGVMELGPVSGARKVGLVARARALLFPIQWEEPFGLVMIEAMLSGVPVLATNRGSVSEIVDDGVTGVVCDDPAEMVAAARISEKFFDRARIRAIAQERWSAARMARDYLRLYRELIAARVTGLDSSAAGA